MTRRARGPAALLLLGLAVPVGACGKKGPPLAPLRIAPNPVTALSARRVADRVALRFTLPSSNDDRSTPADVARVDVYALSVSGPAEAPSGPAFLEEARLVGSVKVPADAASPLTYVEDMGSDPISQKLPGGLAPRAPVRVYAVVPVSSKGRRGPAARVSVPLAAPPDAPPPPLATYTETAITVRWLAVPAADDAARGTLLYNVYEPAQLPAGPPVNPAPLETPAFEDRRVEFGAERCYAVTALRMIEQVAVESAPSPAACVTPVDTFPPPAPTGLGAVAGPGSISLIWNPVDAADLAGYVVLRGEAPDDTLLALTPDPIRDTTYTDAKVQPGVRYVYAVVAVDQAKNASPQSARVEETSR